MRDEFVLNSDTRISSSKHKATGRLLLCEAFAEIVHSIALAAGLELGGHIGLAMEDKKEQTFEMTLVLSIVAIMAVAVLGLVVWRWLDARADKASWHDLAQLAEPSATVFDLEMILDLPDPAQRFFRYVIAPGTPLHRVVEIEMRGEVGLGTKNAPNYKPMRAKQVLAAPHGLVWCMNAGAISGSDGATRATSWTRFWLFNFIPVVRVCGSADHYRSAMGRVVAEAVFWTPAVLLSSAVVRWEQIGMNLARVVIRAGGFEHVVDLAVAADGQPERVIIQRWSNENPEKLFRLQPFGGDLSHFRSFDGYRLPTRVEGGNLIGTDAYFPFYKADVTAIRFVSGSA